MANPPVTIGPFTNVPAPGSPIKSDWPQQITTAACRAPQRFSGLPNIASGVYSGYQNLVTINIPSATYPRLLAAWLQILLNTTGANTATVAELSIRATGFSTDQRRTRQMIAPNGTYPVTLGLTNIAVAAGVGGTIYAEVGPGPGLGVQVYVDGFFNTLDVVLWPSNTAPS